MKRLLGRLFPRKTESLEEFIELLEQRDCVSIRTKTSCRRLFLSEASNKVLVRGTLQLQANLPGLRPIRYAESKEEVSYWNQSIVSGVEARVRASLRGRQEECLSLIKNHLPGIEFWKF